MKTEQIKSIKVVPYTLPSTSSSSIQDLSSSMRRKKRKCESLRKTWTKYCDSTSLHGFRYLSEPNRSIGERAFWSTAILIAFVTVGIVVKDQVEHFLRSPVLISFETKQTPVTSIPFPAITLCPSTQLKKTYFNLSFALEKRDNLTEEEEKKFHLALRMCSLFSFTQKNWNFDRKFVEEMIESINGKESCRRFFHSTMLWERSFFVDPCDHLQPTVTYAGACFTFNMLPVDQILKNAIPNWSSKKFWGKERTWTPDEGYLAKAKNSKMPWSVRRASIAYGAAMFFMKIKLDEYDPVCSRKPGFIGFVHNPAELPGVLHPAFYIQDGMSMIIQIYPKMYSVDKRLKQWNAKERGCYFDTERNLRYFKIYTQRSCELECDANFTLQNCGCSTIFHPTLDVNNITYCGPSIYNCVMTKREKAASCDCLPSCSELQYEIKTSSIPTEWPDHFVDHIKNKDPNIRYCHIEVQYESNYVQGITRASMFGLSDFMANIGGLLGLFLGFSILSVVEVVYFVTLRFYTNSKMERKEREKRLVQSSSRKWDEVIF